MKRITRNLLLLIMAVSLLACFALTASAAEYESMDDAIGYLDSYADNVGVEAGIDLSTTPSPFKN